MQGEVVFSFFSFVCGTFLLSKELWEPKEELRVLSIVVKNCQKKSKGVFLLEVHYRVGFDSNTSFEITKVMFRPWRVVRFLIWAREHLKFQIQVFFAFFGLCTSVCAHTCSFCFRHEQAHSSFYSCLPHLSLSPCVLPRFLPFFLFAMVCLPYSVHCCHTRTQDGKIALDHAKECDRADCRAELVALLEWWERRCDVATWYQKKAIVSSPIPGMIVGSFLCPLSPPFFCALWLFTRLHLIEVHVICRYQLYVFFKMISFFLLPSFSCFQMKPTSNKKNEWKKKSERERKKRKRSSGAQR